jgi:hypothetical protein
LRYWAQREHIAAGYLDWITKISPPVFNFLEEYFQQEFSLPKAGISFLIA